MPFPSFETFHNSFPLSFLSETKKTSPILHDNGQRAFYLEVDLTQLFTVTFPLKDICPEGIPALYLPSITSVAPNTPNYVNVSSTLGQRKTILGNGDMLSLDKRYRVEYNYTSKSRRHFHCSLNTEVRKS